MRASNFILTTLVAASFITVQSTTNALTVGILTTSSDIEGYARGDFSYISASYARYFEDAGAEIVPIPYDASYENFTFLLNRVNGVVLTGGNAELNYTDESTGEIKPTNITAASAFVIQYALQKNKNGTHFPVFAICQGFETLLMTLSNNFNILTHNYTEKNLQNTLKFLPTARKDKMWEGLSEDLSNLLTSTDVLNFNLHYGIQPWRFESNGGISSVLKMLTVTKPKNKGPIFVSSVAGRKYPIFGTAFHPEKNGYIKREDVNATHSTDAKLAMEQLSHVFIEHAKKNNQSFETGDLLQSYLISKWPIVIPSKDFDEAYMFQTVNTSTSMYPNLFLHN